MATNNAMQLHPNSLANLREPWKPGESGNKAGINQYSFRDEARENLSRWLREKDVQTGQTNSQLFINRVCEEATTGKEWAAKLLWQESLKENPHSDSPSIEPIGIDALNEKLDAFVRSEEQADPHAMIAFHQDEIRRLVEKYPDAKPIEPDFDALACVNGIEKQSFCDEEGT